MNKDELEYLFRRYQNRQCTPAELDKLRSFLKSDDAIDLLENIWDDIQKEKDNPSPDVKSDAATIYRNILEDPRLAKEERPIFITPKWYLNRTAWASAAATAILVAGMWLFVSKQKSLSPNNVASINSKAQAVVPGRERAKIVFDDGSSFDLEQASGDTVLKKDDFLIVKQKDGSIHYRYNTQLTPHDQATYNTIITPKGGEYQVELPDGSRVWLNAQTSLRYPVYFNEDVRQVELDGEAYFDVAKYAKSGKPLPFIVQTRDQQLEVLGTSFNINSFNHNITTTLVEGKVKLQSLNLSGQAKILKPNEQSVYNEQNKKFTISEVDPLYATSWKNGNFSFDQATIKEVMESIARWYDVEITYEGAFTTTYFSGTISKFEQIDKLLETIELAGGVHFKIQGRRIIVTQ